jgi:hypothetical protein
VISKSTKNIIIFLNKKLALQKRINMDGWMDSRSSSVAQCDGMQEDESFYIYFEHY